MAEGDKTSILEKQVRVVLISPPRATSTIFTRCMSTVPNSQIFSSNYANCKNVVFCVESMGKVIDYQADNISDEDWRRAAEMFVGEDCSGDRLDVELLK